MSTGKEIADRIAAECGGVKPWQQRFDEVPDTGEWLSRAVTRIACMQDEIDELREQVKGLHAENELQLDSLKVAAAENARLRDDVKKWQALVAGHEKLAHIAERREARLRDALETIKTATACSYAKNIARAALGKS